MSAHHLETANHSTDNTQGLGFGAGSTQSPFDAMALLKEGHEMKTAGLRDVVCSTLPFSGVCEAGDKLGEVNAKMKGNSETKAQEGPKVEKNEKPQPAGSQHQEYLELPSIFGH